MQKKYLSFSWAAVDGKGFFVPAQATFLPGVPPFLGGGCWCCIGCRAWVLKVRCPEENHSSCCCAVKVPEDQTVQQGAQRLALGFGMLSWNAVTLSFPKWSSTSSCNTRSVSKMIKGTRLSYDSLQGRKVPCVSIQPQFLLSLWQGSVMLQLWEKGQFN